MYNKTFAYDMDIPLNYDYFKLYIIPNLFILMCVDQVITGGRRCVANRRYGHLH